MRILIGDKGNVDFDEAIQMSPKQKAEFLKFMKSLFDVVIEEEVDELRSDRLGDRVFFRKWTSEELKILLEIEDTNKVCERLGRSWMSVDIMRGGFIPEFMYWAHIKGYDIVYGDTKKLIEEFMEEKEKEKQERRNARRAEKNELPNLKQKLENFQRKLEAIKLRIRCGMKTPDDENIISETEREIREVEEKIKQKERRGVSILIPELF